MQASLTPSQVAALTELFRLLGEPNRLRLVLACLDAPRSVGALVESLGLSQTLVSHHLRLLRSAHVLRGDRHGRQVLYAIDDEHVRDTVRNMIAHVTEPHDHRLTNIGADQDDAATSKPDDPSTSTSKEKTMANDTQCACKDCVCTVATDKAVTKDGAMYCCEECASGHAHHDGCDHNGCNCHG